MRKRLSYANVMSTIAVILALGGTSAFAASQLAKNSVGPKQLKKNAVTAAKIKKGAVDGSKVRDGSLTASDLSPSVLAPYAKHGEFLNGNDVVTPDPLAGLGKPIYNVGGGGVDCQGTSADEFPDALLDDIDFESVEFDSGGVAHTEPSAAANCYNGFSTPRAGKYLITGWIDWEADDDGYREIAIRALRPGKACCSVLTVDSRDSTTSAPTAQGTSAIADIPAGTFVFLQGQQNSGGPLKFAGGGLQISWLGP